MLGLFGAVNGGVGVLAADGALDCDLGRSLGAGPGAVSRVPAVLAEGLLEHSPHQGDLSIVLPLEVHVLGAHQDL